MTYEEQRKQRLDEAVFDYINDEKVTPTQFCEELNEVLESHSNYYQEKAMRVDRMRQLVREGITSPDTSRYSQYTEQEIDSMCSDETDRICKEDLNLMIQANSPYNDGWTREFYKDEVEHSKYYYDFDRNR